MKQLALATLLSLSVAAPSILAVPKPTKCPSASALQNVKFELAENTTGDEHGPWAVGVLRNQYDTEDTWTFVLDGLKAKNSDDALKIGNAAVKNLSFNQGPLENAFGMWVCTYNTPENYQAFAYTPAYEGNNKLSLRK